MHAPSPVNKALPRSNTSVSLSGDEIRDIEEAARSRQQSRAEFIRGAAVVAARKLLKQTASA
jgi:uncharacterized protein (DUF1778 family)